MNKKQKVLIYPYSRDAVALVLYLQNNSQLYEVSHLIAPNCMGGMGKDAGTYFNLPAIGILIESNFVDCLKDIDAVFFVWSKMNMLITPKYQENLKYALQCNKKVICFDILERNFLETLEDYISKKQLIYYPQIRNSVERENVKNANSELQSISVPIIFFGETMNGLESYDVMVNMAIQFGKKGYKVSAIGDKSYNEIIGVNRIPDYCNQSDSNNYIYGFNAFVKRIEDIEKPDIIFINLPGAIMKYNNFLSNDFGIIPYLLSQAVTADLMILTVPYDKVEIKYFEILNNICQYRLGVELHSVCMSNSFFDVQSAKQERNLSYLQLEQDRLNENLQHNYKELNIMHFNAYNETDCKRVCESLINVLS